MALLEKGEDDTFISPLLDENNGHVLDLIKKIKGYCRRVSSRKGNRMGYPFNIALIDNMEVVNRGRALREAHFGINKLNGHWRAMAIPLEVHSPGSVKNWDSIL